MVTNPFLENQIPHLTGTLYGRFPFLFWKQIGYYCTL